MTKKISIFVFLVVIPNLLGWIYDKIFRYSGNFFEQYQNYFKLGFLIISVLSTGWLIVISKKERSYIWLWLFIVLFILLAIYLFFAIAVINSSY